MIDQDCDGDLLEAFDKDGNGVAECLEGGDDDSAEVDEGCDCDAGGGIEGENSRWSGLGRRSGVEKWALNFLSATYAMGV